MSRNEDIEKWFSRNDDQQNTIDSILDDLHALKLDETVIARDHSSKLIELIESLSTIGEEIYLKLQESYSLSTRTIQIIKTSGQSSGMLKERRY